MPTKIPESRPPRDRDSRWYTPDGRFAAGIALIIGGATLFLYFSFASFPNIRPQDIEFMRVLYLVVFSFGGGVAITAAEKRSANKDRRPRL